MLTEPKWHRDMKYWQVNKVWREYRSITRDELRRIEYHRVFIPKPNGKERPLGVPSVA
jgi:retron-type reverse transcriptase